jgi:hypothetical protein
MIYVLKAKHYYYEHKYETSVDFSEIRHQMSQSNDDVEHALSPFELTEKLTSMGRTVLELKAAIDANRSVIRHKKNTSAYESAAKGDDEPLEDGV